MQKNRKADRARIGSKTFGMPGRNKLAFSSFHSMGSMPARQCKNCRSDNMRWAVDDTCQRCLQRIEFRMREKLNGGRA